MLYNELPNFASLRVFGSLSFATTLIAHMTKLDSRARNVFFFLGFKPGTEEYVLLDILNRNIFISMNVVFHEHIFPLHAHSHSIPAISLPKDTFILDSDVPPCILTLVIKTISNLFFTRALYKK